MPPNTLQDPAGGASQVESLQEFNGAGSRRAAPQPAQFPEHHQVLPSGQRIVQRGVLVGHADVAPDPRRLSDHVVPGHQAHPPSGTASVVRMRTAVVFPAPLGPSTARIEPRGDIEVDPAEQGTQPAPAASAPLINWNTLPSAAAPLRTPSA
jgi:hypothetical protein